MVRTRDFILYVAILLFLLLGIAFTISIEGDTSKSTFSAHLSFITTEPATVGVLREPLTMDRQSNIETLREKLARGDGVITQGPPVFDSVDTPAVSIDEPTQNQDAIYEESYRTPEYCTSHLSFEEEASRWPSTGVKLSIVEGARLVLGVRSHTVTFGSSTVSTSTEVTLLQLPISPERGWNTSCIDSEIIGVALDGTLIRNDETWRFRDASVESVVGYARDGHPIYGQGIDESVLDSCGGYDSGVGYRYHLREHELFMIGCFAATPQPLR